MNNGKECHLVVNKKIKEYLENGYVFGRINVNKKKGIKK